MNQDTPTIEFDSIEELKKVGFNGFKKMSNLFADSSVIPRTKGIYLVLNLDNKPPEFLPVGTGGHFKKKIRTSQLMNYVQTGLTKQL